jgi:hypothetical protein
MSKVNLGAVRTVKLISLIGFVSGLVGCALYDGVRGAASCLLGAIATGFSFLANDQAISLTSGVNTLPGLKLHRLGPAMSLLVILMKLPLFLGAAFWAKSFGGPAMGCFLAGLALVYCLLIGRALASS